MFRFSIDKETPLDASPSQLTQNAITEDEDFPQRLKEVDQYEADERYFRAENANPKSLKEAIEFVQGILFHPPARVWLDGELHEVKASDLRGTDKPTA